MAKALKPEISTRTKQLTLRVPLAQNKQAEHIVTKAKVKRPDYVMADLLREAFSNEIERRANNRPLWTEDASTITEREVAELMLLVAPKIQADLQILIANGLGQTLNDFLRLAIENEVGRRSHKSPPVTVSIETVTQQLDKLLQFAQEARKADILTGLIALELGLAS